MNSTYQVGSTIVHVETVSPLNSDGRGFIITTGRDEEDPVTHYQPRLISTQPFGVRGNHYHQEETETIILLNSKWDFYLADYRGHYKQTHILDCHVLPLKIVVPPNIAHALINQSKEIAFMYHYSNKPYTSNRSVPLILTKGD